MSEKRLQNLLDRQDISDCITRFARGMDRFDEALFQSAFHSDAVIAAGIYVGGPQVLYDWARDLHEHGQVATQHNLLNQTIDIDGEEAHVETYYMFVGRNRDETNWVAGGRYLDRCERREGEWKIALRNTVIEWSGLLPTMPIPFSDLIGVNDNGAPSRDVNDPSYARPLKNVRPLFDPSAS